MTVASVNPLAVAFGVGVLAWVLVLVLMLVLYLLQASVRGRAKKRPDPRRLASKVDAAGVMSGLDELRRHDPDFDVQLLLEAAQTGALLAFTATATGDVAPLSRMVTSSYWSTPYGEYVKTVAHDQRRLAVDAAKNEARRGPAREVPRLPLDYHAAVPQVVRVGRSDTEEVAVRVSYQGLLAMIQPGAAAMARGAAASNSGQAVQSFVAAVNARANRPHVEEVSWVGNRGSFDLTFVRPAGARTDPTATLSDRVCEQCGAPFRSDLAVTCANCGRARPLAWGQWRLAEATPIRVSAGGAGS